MRAGIHDLEHELFVSSTEIANSVPRGPGATPWLVTSAPLLVKAAVKTFITHSGIFGRHNQRPVGQWDRGARTLGYSAMIERIYVFSLILLRHPTVV